jgi:histone H3/H4
MADDDNEVGLPQKGLNMIIKETVPDLRIANETRDLINQCCVEFIRHLSREAQRISSEDQRKTIYHEHVQKALSNLGFPKDYIDAADRVLDECKVNAEKRLRRKNSRLDKCGIPEDKLYEMQQKLIEEARIRADQEAMEQQQQMAVMAMNQGMMNASGGGNGGMPSTSNLTTSGQTFSDAARKFVVSSTAPREEEDYDT